LRNISSNIRDEFVVFVDDLKPGDFVHIRNLKSKEAGGAIEAGLHGTRDPNPRNPFTILEKDYQAVKDLKK
jgi:hypothetical protein